MAKPRRIRSLIVTVLVSGVFLYAALVTLLYLGQRQLLFRPDPVFHGVAELDLPGYRDATIDTGDGERLVALYRPADPGRNSVLYLHGNGGSMQRISPRLRALAGEGFGVLAVGYRGYSGSTGSPSEEGLAEDARSAFDWLTREAPGAIVVVYGESLGSGVSVRLATERAFAALILDAPYTSIPEVAAGVFPVVPVHWLMKDRFPSDTRVGSLDRPLLIVHGEADLTVPFRLGQRLFELAPEPKRFIRIPGGTHGGNMEAAWDDVKRFIAAPGST